MQRAKIHWDLWFDVYLKDIWFLTSQLDLVLSIDIKHRRIYVYTIIYFFIFIFSGFLNKVSNRVYNCVFFPPIGWLFSATYPVFIGHLLWNALETVIILHDELLAEAYSFRRLDQYIVSTFSDSRNPIHQQHSKPWKTCWSLPYTRSSGISFQIHFFSFGSVVLEVQVFCPSVPSTQVGTGPFHPHHGMLWHHPWRQTQRWHLELDMADWFLHDSPYCEHCTVNLLNLLRAILMPSKCFKCHFQCYWWNPMNIRPRFCSVKHCNSCTLLTQQR